MRFKTNRLRLLASLPLLLLLEACPGSTPPSTASSIARTERPQLPRLDPALVKRETLTPMSGRRSGEPITVDKGWLTELVERFAEAAAAVARGNTRAGGVEAERACVAGVFETGVLSPGCG